MAVDLENIQQDYLGQQGLYNLDAFNINDLPAGEKESVIKAFTESDKHQILDDGSVAFLDKDGSTQFVPASANEKTIDISGFDANAVAELADLKYLAQNTGVKTSDLNAVYEKLGIAGSTYSGSDVSNESKVADDILKAYGYNPGEQNNFYGNTSGPQDVGAQILYDRWSQAPSDEELEAAGLDPAEYSVVNSNAANAFYLEQELNKKNIAASNTKGLLGSTSGFLAGNLSGLGMQGARNPQDVRDELDNFTTQQAPNSYWAKKSQETGMTPSEMQLDMLEWDLVKNKQEGTGVDTSGYTPVSGNVNLTGGVSNIPTGGQITGGGVGTVTPSYSSTPSIGTVTPTYGGEQTGLTEYTIPTYECCLGQQATDFANRATCQATFYQPQTQAEKEAAGTAPTFENKLYRNRFGMTTYIQHINGVPSQPIPPGYFLVQDFTDQSQTQAGSAVQANQGGMIQGFATGAVICQNPDGKYLFYNASTGSPIRNSGSKCFTFDSPDQAASWLSSNTGKSSMGDYYLQAGGAYNFPTDYSTEGVNVNPALQYQPGGSVVQTGEGFKILYPDGTMSQGYQNYAQAQAAQQSGLSNLGLADYNTYLQQQGVDPNLPGYNEQAYKDLYQAYLTDPASIAQAEFNKEQEEKKEFQAQQPSDATVGGDQPLGETTVTPEQLAQYQANLNAQAFAQPGGAVAASPVSYIDPNAYGSVIESTAGQAQSTAPMVTEDQVAQIASATTADTPQKIGSQQVTSQAAFSDIQNATTGMTAAQMTGGPSKQIDAAQQTGTSLAGLTSQTADSINVANAPIRGTTRMDGVSEFVEGTGVDQAQVGQAFGTGEIQAASVQGELANLMSQFDDGQTPAWAAGSMRAATQMLAARGLGASSMAGQAVIQAAMEAALPIAQIDTANKQQVALFKAEQRAKFLQMDFDQAFQAKVMNAAKVSEIANMNFTADQQIALENSKAANTMQLQNLSNEQALVMAEAAALSQMDMANLNNRQQAAVQNAQNFLQVDMANLSNSQQTALFKQQSLINSILGDQAAANAAQQFNATSENQTNQFFANLGASVNQFNAAQINAMKQFNADEVNGLLEFNAALQNQREMFNAQNYLVVAQANAQWRQNLETVNNAAANQANMEYARNVNNLTQAALDEIWMRERDLLSMAFQSSENTLARNNAIVLQKLAADASTEAAQLQADIEAESGASNLLASVFMKAVGLI